MPAGNHQVGHSFLLRTRRAGRWLLRKLFFDCPREAFDVRARPSLRHCDEQAVAETLVPAAQRRPHEVAAPSQSPGYLVCRARQLEDQLFEARPGNFTLQPGISASLCAA